MSLKRKCIVAKFGGSSLADKIKIVCAAKSVAKEVMKGTRVVVVVSAIGRTTDFLLDTSKEACGGDISGKDLDGILSMGERTSARIFSAVLNANNIRCRFIDPIDPEWPIITDRQFTNAKPILPICEKMIQAHVLPLIEKMVIVIPGFIGKTEDGLITTIGRGGSDTTALILARGLSADQVILVTDVDGVMSADPNIIKKAQRLKEIHVDELTGLADSGAKFIHKKALKYKDPSIAIKVINHAFKNLDSDGTIIYGSLPSDVTVEMSYNSPTSAVTIVGKDITEAPQVLQEAFKQVNLANTPILGMSVDQNSLILYIPEKNINLLLEALHSMVIANKNTLALAVRKNLAFIKIKGVGLEETPGIISKLAASLYSKKINIFGIFTITSSVLVFVDFGDGEMAIKSIRESIKEDFH